MSTLAVIVPYRDRKKHLDIFVPYISGYLHGRDISNYIIVIVEQNNDSKFNRGTLINIGFDYIKHRCDYISPHDVDLLPEKNCDYSFPENPCHLIAGRSETGYQPEPGYFGGVNLFSNEQFKKINGFSNCYGGYGAEDDDLKLRFIRNNFHIEQRNGYYKSLYHDHSYVDPKNLERNRNQYYSLARGNSVFSEFDGLSDLKYSLVSEENESDMKLIHINVDFGEYNFEDYQ